MCDSYQINITVLCGGFQVRHLSYIYVKFTVTVVYLHMIGLVAELKNGELDPFEFI